MNQEELINLKEELYSLKYDRDQIIKLRGIPSEELLKEIADLEIKIKNSSNHELEEKFRQEFEKVDEKIQECLDQSMKALRAAINISEETGIPFNTRIFCGRNVYYPRSFKKYQELDDDFFSREFDFYPNGGIGWQHSGNTC